MQGKEGATAVVEKSRGSKAPAELAAKVTGAERISLLPDPVEIKEIAEALAAPFEVDEVKWKPQTISSNRAKVVAFVDARVIQDRLDEVLGVMGWQDSYECLPDGSVMCRLRIRLGGEWIEKMDVGGQSEQPDEGDRRKAAFSDALKRAAVKFGIGRYLYRLEGQWVDYDPQKKRILGTPHLPAEAMPFPAKAGPTARPAAAQPTVAANRPVEQTAPAPVVNPVAAPAAKGPKKAGKVETRQEPAATPAPAAPAAKADQRPGRGIPANGDELHRRLHDKDGLLAKEGLCKAGDLVKYVAQAGVKAGFDPDLTSWRGPAIQLAIEETRAFEARCRQGGTREVA